MKHLNFFIWIFSLTFDSLSVDGQGTQSLLLISFDGFRWDYLDMVKRSGMYSIPNFDYFIQNGVTIDNGGVKNAFITKTFPNHYTIVTGMYEENHGLVGNVMFDPKFNISSDIYHGLSTNPLWFNNGTNETSAGAEPIWITNQKNTHLLFQRNSGVYFWPGSEVPIQGMRPTFWFPYNKSTPFETRIDTAIEWFEKSLINLGLLYFNEPDHSGHQYGPNAPEILKVISRLDGILGRLKDGLERAKLLDKLNIIITSDHGMASVNPKQYINIKKYISVDYFDVYGTGVIANIFPKENQTKHVYEALNKVNHMTVYLKEDIPKQYHYHFNRRIGPILAVADEGWEITLNINETYKPLGDHGYNNSLPDMQPIFIAMGPAFKNGTKVSQFNNVDIYPLMCHVLNILPGRNDGSLDNIMKVLKVAPGQGMISKIMILTIVAICLLGLVACVLAYCIWRPKRRSIVIVNGKTEATSNNDDEAADKLLDDNNEYENDEIA